MLLLLPMHLLSALCSVSAITSGNLSTEVANFRFQLPHKNTRFSWFYLSPNKAFEALALFHSLGIYKGTSPVCNEGLLPYRFGQIKIYFLSTVYPFLYFEYFAS